MHSLIKKKKLLIFSYENILWSWMWNSSSLCIRVWNLFLIIFILFPSKDNPILLPIQLQKKIHCKSNPVHKARTDYNFKPKPSLIHSQQTPPQTHQSTQTPSPKSPPAWFPLVRQHPLEATKAKPSLQSLVTSINSTQGKILSLLVVAQFPQAINSKSRTKGASTCSLFTVLHAPVPRTAITWCFRPLSIRVGASASSKQLVVDLQCVN